MKTHDETKLPKWAQERITTMARDADYLRRQLDAALKANAIMAGHWFTIQGPKFNSDEKYRKLFYCDRDGTHQACELSPGDVLLVGKAEARQ